MALNRIQQIIVVCIVAFIVAGIMRYLIYEYTGWKSFTMTKGENFQITDLDPTLVSKLKFRDCVFTIKGLDGTVKSYTVTYVLNTMLSAYENNNNKNYVFKLDDPGLSIYSFQVPGFNDKTNKPDPSNWSDDIKTEVTLIGYYKLLN